jgi:hypothetical protein
MMPEMSNWLVYSRCHHFPVYYWLVHQPPSEGELFVFSQLSSYVDLLAHTGLEHPMKTRTVLALHGHERSSCDTERKRVTHNRLNLVPEYILFTNCSAVLESSIWKLPNTCGYWKLNRMKFHCENLYKWGLAESINEGDLEITEYMWILKTGQNEISLWEPIQMGPSRVD